MFDKIKDMAARLTNSVSHWSSVGVIIKGDRVFVDGKELLGQAKTRELKRMSAFFTEMEEAMTAMDGAMSKMDDAMREFTNHKNTLDPDRDDSNVS